MLEVIYVVRSNPLYMNVCSAFAAVGGSADKTACALGMSLSYVNILIARLRTLGAIKGNKLEASVAKYIDIVIADEIKKKGGVRGSDGK